MQTAIELRQLQQACMKAKKLAEESLYGCSFQTLREVENITAVLTEQSITFPASLTQAITNANNLCGDVPLILAALENKIQAFEVQIRAAETTRTEVN